MIGYATLYTFGPVFTLVLDRDVDEPLSTLYPELYKDLNTSRSLSYRTLPSFGSVFPSTRVVSSKASPNSSLQTL